MRDPQNIAQTASLTPDYMGFIFFDRSPRHAGEMRESYMPPKTAGIKRVGVFVNAPYEEIMERVERLGLDLVQLHGDETVELCREVRRQIQVIKAVSISSPEDIVQAEAIYDGEVDFLLFDTKTPKHGGSGEQFDWSILQTYRGKTPFFLSGGIGIGDAERINALRHPMLHAIDINSRFEITPAVKNTDLLRQFLCKINR